MFLLIACSKCLSSSIFNQARCKMLDAVQCFLFTKNKLNTEVLHLHAWTWLIRSKKLSSLLLSPNLGSRKHARGATIFVIIKKFCNYIILFNYANDFVFELATLSLYISISYDRVPSTWTSLFRTQNKDFWRK